MVFSVSPSVTVREVDLTTTIPAITTPPAAIAGVFRWGPVNERVLISSEVELVNVFGEPTDLNAETFFTAADYLSYSNALYVTRVVDETANTAIVTNIADDVVFQAKYPGSIANGIEISYIVTSDQGVSDFAADIFSVATTYDITFREQTLDITTDQALIDIDVKVGDVLRIDTSSGYQDMEILALETLSTSPTSNTEFEYVHSFIFRERFTMVNAPTDVTRRWAYADAFGEAPEAGKMQIISVTLLLVL